MKGMMMTGISAALGGGGGSGAQGANTPQRSGEMIYRTLGRAGERVSAIGMGGFHIGQPKLSENESLRLIRHCAVHNGSVLRWDFSNDSLDQQICA